MAKRARAGTVLYAWARPVAGLPRNVDHTWVTTFDCRVGEWPSISDVQSAGQLYWYCWGDYHAKCRANGDLVSRAGNLALAQCLVTPNLRSDTGGGAEGTIFRYGVDGVCHQLANQVLYATATGGLPPLTVAGARGYITSVYLYGRYGKGPAARAFDAKIRSCGGDLRWRSNDTMPDEFEKRARDVLGAKAPEKLEALLSLHKKSLRTDYREFSGNAVALNARNQAVLDEAAQLLGPKHFRAVFGFAPDEKINLVDPAQMKSAGRLPARRSKGHRPIPMATLHATANVGHSATTMPTVTLKHFAAALAQSHAMSKKQAEAVLGDFVGNVVKHLKKGERIRIGGLGVLQVRKRAARLGRNPATGQQMRIKSSKKIAFRAAKELKESI